MDYGKLALIKAEQLEKENGGVSAIIDRAGLKFEKDIAANQDFKICDISGAGAAGLIVSLVFASGSGNTEILIDKKTVFAKPFDTNLVFMASVTLSASHKISIKTDGKTKLLSADVMVIGGQIINSGVGEVKISTFGSYTAAVHSDEGEVRISIGANNKMPDFSKYYLVGFGSKFAVAPVRAFYLDCFAVCYLDESGTVRLTVIAAYGEVLGHFLPGIDASAVCLSSNGNQLIIGYVFKGYAYAAILGVPDFTPGFTIKLEEAADISFVRDSVPPAVILDKKTGYALRLAQQEYPSEDTVSIFIDCEAL